MTREIAITRTLAKLDEVAPQDGSLVLGVNVNPVRQLVDGELNPATEDLLLSSTTTLLTNYPITGMVITGGVGRVRLPDDFLRIAYVRMSDWNRPVNEAITEDSPDYSKQRNPYTRAGTQKPVVAITNDKWLECYTTSLIGDVRYIKRQFLTTESQKFFDASLEDRLVWLCAMRVLTIAGKGELVKLLAQQMR